MEKTITKCPTCGLGRNPAQTLCPKCDKGAFIEAVKNGLNPFDHMRAGRIIWMVIAAMGLNYLIPAIVFVFAFAAKIADGTLDIGVQNIDIEAFIAAEFPTLQTVSLFIGQCLAALAVVLILRKYLGAILLTFTKYKAILKSVIIMAVVIVIGTGWSNLTISLLELGDNQNQAMVIDELKKMPVIGFLSTAIGAPLLEELAFRCGLFGLIKRKSRVWAYIISSILFVLIHVSFDGANLLAELLAIPAYLLSAVVLCYIYDKHGFACSLIAHMLNNAVAAVVIFIFA